MAKLSLHTHTSVAHLPGDSWAFLFMSVASFLYARHYRHSHVHLLLFCYFLRQLMHVDLHWLDVVEWVKFKLVSMVHNCFHHKAPWYLMDYCIPISDMASQQHCRSARHHYLVVLWHSLSSYGCRAFAVAQLLHLGCPFAVGHLPNCLELTEQWSAWSDA